jgi:molybdopterin-guanine dinucleotide biosynthesis protein A
MTSLWAILNGGESSRYGSPKYLAARNGESFLNVTAKRTIEASSSSDKIVLSGGPTLGAPWDVIADSPHFTGPLAGLLALVQLAMEAKHEVLTIQPIDMPMVHSEHLRMLHNQALHTEGVVVAESQLSKDRHWVLAAIHCSQYEDVATRIESGSFRSVKSVWASCACEFLALPDEYLVNINYPDQAF